MGVEGKGLAKREGGGDGLGVGARWGDVLDVVFGDVEEFLGGGVSVLFSARLVRYCADWHRDELTVVSGRLFGSMAAIVPIAL
jgi:hypothetical protein